MHRQSLSALAAASLLGLTLSAGASFAGTSERAYGDANGWNVVALLDGTRFTGCAASHQQIDGQAGIAYSADGNWLLLFEMPTPQGEIPAQMSIDGRSWNFSVIGQGNRVSFGPSLQMMDAVRAGSRLTISVQGASFTTTLTGSSAAMTMIQTCVNRRGG
ncbi:hypothetical protein [Pararhodobacter aggregans]|uniref:hypothetical protein n=1 Tax=Pararhodobacter aggregans TaxID=404875 RepID=UPI003A902506